MKYRKKPITVDAVQWFNDGDHASVHRFVYEYGEKDIVRFGIQTLEGTMWVKPGDWIVGPGAKGEYWPVDNEIFQMTYERVE